MRTFLFFFIFFIVVYACSVKKEHTNFKFKNREFLLQQPTLLRTDGVYLRNTSNVNYEGVTVVGYMFYRFYKNGRCYVSSWHTGIPNDSILRSTDKISGQRTFFRNESNSILIELWGGYYSGYIYEYGTIDSTLLIINAAKSRVFWSAKLKYSGDIYEFKMLDLSEKADW